MIVNSYNDEKSLLHMSLTQPRACTRASVSWTREQGLQKPLSGAGWSTPTAQVQPSLPDADRQLGGVDKRAEAGLEDQVSYALPAE